MAKFITKRYTFSQLVSGDDGIKEPRYFYRLLTDLPEGHSHFVQQAKANSDILKLSAEYVCEYDSDSLIAPADLIFSRLDSDVSEMKSENFDEGIGD